MKRTWTIIGVADVAIGTFLAVVHLICNANDRAIESGIGKPGCPV